MKTVAIVGTLDTKGTEFAFLKAEIEKLGCATLVIDAGASGKPAFTPDIGLKDILAEGEDGRTELDMSDRGAALDILADLLPKAVKRLFDARRFDGIISMGGGGGTALGTGAMRPLPIGVPKVMVSTLASADTGPYVGSSDIMMIPSIVDVSGLNRISRTIFANAAAAVCGMVNAIEDKSETDEARPLIAASMFGNTTRAVDHARKLIEEAGFEVLVFHATGAGGRTMERLIGEGYFAGVLDITTTEWADELCGGALSAGAERLAAAASSGVPQVGDTGLHRHVQFLGARNHPCPICRTPVPSLEPQRHADADDAGRERGNGPDLRREAFGRQGPRRGPGAMKGFSEIDAPGKPFWWPEADQAFVDALRAGLRADIPVQLLDYNVNDAEFAEQAANTLLQMLNKRK